MASESAPISYCFVAGTGGADDDEAVNERGLDAPGVGIPLERPGAGMPDVRGLPGVWYDMARVAQSREVTVLEPKVVGPPRVRILTSTLVVVIANGGLEVSACTRLLLWQAA